MKAGPLAQLRTQLAKFRSELADVPVGGRGRWAADRVREHARFLRARRAALRRRVQPEICYSVKQELVRAPGARYRALSPGTTVFRRPPRTVDAQLHEAFVRDPAWTVREKYVATIPSARLVGPHGLVVLPDGSFAVESTFGSEPHLRADRGYFTPIPERVCFKTGAFFSLVMTYATAGSYYHWIHDVLLNLHLVLEHLPPDIRFIVPPNLRQFQLDSLAALGIPSTQLCEFDGTDTWQMETLYFSANATPSGTDSPDADRWLRDRFLEYFGVETVAPTGLIYVSRRDALWRRAINEAQIEELLAAYGFETYLLETLTLAEQVKLFAGAKAIVAPHGAALTNMLFAPGGAVVVDLLEPQEINRCYWNMSEALGHEYWYVLSESVPNPGSIPDMLVSAEKLERTLARSSLVLS